MKEIRYEEYCYSLPPIYSHEKKNGPNHLFFEYNLQILLAGICENSTKTFCISFICQKFELLERRGNAKMMFYLLLKFLAARGFQKVSVSVAKEYFNSIPFWENIAVLSRQESTIDDQSIHFTGPVCVDIYERTCKRAIILDHSLYRVLLYRSHLHDFYACPGGGMEPCDDNDPHICLIRELEEECGWDDESQVAYSISSHPIFIVDLALDGGYKVDGKVCISKESYYKVVMAPSPKLPMPRNHRQTLQESSSGMQFKWINRRGAVCELLLKVGHFVKYFQKQGHFVKGKR